jgi:hypothetical protein
LFAVFWGYLLSGGTYTKAAFSLKRSGEIKPVELLCVSCGVHRLIEIAPDPFFHGRKATKGFAPEKDCDQTLMGLSPVTFTVFFKAELFW